MKAAILRREYIMFLALSSKYLSISKREIEQKLLSHNYESVSWLIVYGITNSSKFWGTHVSLIFVIWGTCMGLTIDAIFIVSFILFFKDV